MIDLFKSLPKVKEYDPDERAAMGMRPRAPVCQRCNREATFENPVGVTFRPSWNPLDRNDRGNLDALCAECRERFKG